MFITFLEHSKCLELFWNTQNIKNFSEVFIGLVMLPLVKYTKLDTTFIESIVSTTSTCR